MSYSNELSSLTVKGKNNEKLKMDCMRVYGRRLLYYGKRHLNLSFELKCVRRSKR